MLFFYLAVLITALYWVSRILLPELIKKESFDSLSSDAPDKRIEKLEALLAEKNTNITLLQKNLSIFHTQIRAFDRVKALMDEEIHHLRVQNRIFRSELGLPTAQPKEKMRAVP